MVSDGKTRRRMNQREWECFEDGVNYERDRIILLLDAQIGLGHCDRCNFNLEGCNVANLIALIKGQK